MEFSYQVLTIVVDVFLALLVITLVAVVVMYIIDVRQTEHAVRRNYPVIGRFRYLFEHLGEFFRQYFFAMDREELPFNRAERSWVYRAAKGADTTVAFGSTRDLRPTGTVLFVNCPYPTLERDALEAAPIVFGPTPPTHMRPPASSTSPAMSYGAISSPAVRALSKGAKQAGSG